ncbi:methylated-DNA--[protein]-cysteine S-methyltransferase [Helicobacter himalayensis]|uniref:methylated-DNA--[protein]-cysteine S-methyltransferase n=1 Tax=Helicobacter himalayensis TaxID=1591088 RepID=UPI003D6E0BD9
MLDRHYYHSVLGKLTLASNGVALVGLWFEGQKYFGDVLQIEAQDFKTLRPSTDLESSAKLAFNTHSTRESDTHKVRKNRSAEVFAQTCKWLDEYFNAKIPDFTPPLAICTTIFRQSVWEILLNIPYGKTMTYGEIAQILAHQRGGVKMSARAVGTAVGHNPIALIIPCHRVIGSNNALTGFAAGVDKKEYLLRLEGIYC